MKQTDDQMGHFLLRVCWIAVVCALLWAGFWVATRYLLPFVLGFLIAWLLKPLIVRISSLLRIRRKFTGMAVTLLLYLLLAGLVWWIGAVLIGQALRFLQQFPSWWQELWQGKLQPLWQGFQLQADRLLERMNLAGLSSLWELGDRQLSDLLSGLWEKVLAGFADLAAALPSFLFTLTVTILASLFITMDYKNITAFLARQLPEKYCRWIGETKVNLLQTMGRMCKAYLILMLVTFGELFVALLLLRVESALLLSAVIALADLLPLIGTGGIMVPWVLLELVQGNYFLATGLAISYAIISLVRSILEPRVLGRQVGLHPVVALFSMYTGIRLFGFWGLLFMPLLVLTVKDLNDTGKIPLWKTAPKGKGPSGLEGKRSSE